MKKADKHNIAAAIPRHHAIANREFVLIRSQFYPPFDFERHQTVPQFASFWINNI